MKSQSFSAVVFLGSCVLLTSCGGSSGGGTGTGGGGGGSEQAPTVSSISPATVTAGVGPLTLTVNGSGFINSTTVQVGGVSDPTTYVSSSQVTATVSASQIASGGTLSVAAFNGSASSGTGTPVNLQVNNPMPTVSSISPAAVLTGAGATTVTITGTGFVGTSTVLLNGTAVTTTYVSPTQLTFSFASQTATSVNTLAVSNPLPDGGTAQAGYLPVLTPTSAPVITSVSPTQFVAGSGATYLYVYGSNFMQQVGTGSYVVTGTVQWNGVALTTAVFIGASQELIAQVPASLLTSLGNATVTVTSTTSTQASNAVTVPITNPPPPTLTSIYPSSGPVNTATAITLSGTGFNPNSTVAVNGTNIAAQYVSSTELTATIPASVFTLQSSLNVTVTTPAPGGGTTAPLVFSTYLGITNNDIVYNPADGLIYASVPGSAASMGNSVIGIDPVTGNVNRQIWVGSNPNKLALSTDHTQLFIGIDGAGVVAQVNLGSGTVVNQFSLGGGSGVYNPPYTAAALAAVPGLPNSVAVLSTDGIVSIYDSGVARSLNSSGLINTYFDQNSGSLSFGGSASTLYISASPFEGVEALTVGPSGITAGSNIYSTVVSGYIQYDNGNLYLPNGVVLNASTGNLEGTFYATASSPATGPVVSDSTLGLAFIGTSASSSGTSAVLAFSESTFNPSGNIPFSGASSGALGRIVRWGQNGLAINTPAQIFIFQSPVVQNLSSSPADLSVSLNAPKAATTGGAFSYTATVNNLGPNPAQRATLALTLDSSLIVNSITASQGSCGTGVTFTCDLGDLANGASATVTVSVTPTDAQTVAGSASVTSVSYDPVLSDDESTSSTTVTGSFFAMAPVMSSISPSFVQAGSSEFTLTVTGTGFNSASTVNLNGTALSTSYESSTELTATVNADQVTKYGWAAITVTNPSPGGGTSQVTSLTIYGVVNVTANSILFDPFSQQIYATIPSASTTVPGNSIVAISPVTGTVGSPIPIGSQPTVMAETSDGNYLYVGLAGSDSLAQFDLVHQTVVATIPIQYDSSDVTPTYLAAMPGTDSTLAMDFTNTWGNFGIFDISGSTGTFRPNLSGIYAGVDPVFASPTELYAYDSQTTGAEFYRYSINSTGLTLIDGTTLNGMGGFNGGFDLAGGLVYGGAGGIANPSTTPPSQIAVLALPEFYAQGISEYGVGAVADPSTQQDFVMMENAAGTWEYGLASFNTTTYLPENTIVMPASASNIESTWTMFRFGQSGLALLSVPESAVSPTATSVLILIEGPFVTPQLLGSNSAATLSSSSSASLTHGSGNTVLTLTGSGFAPGVAVTWNGSYRTTTVVDSDHVTVDIPASDLTSAGSASVVATNPGGPASNTLTIAIN